MAQSLVIEEDRGTCTGRRHSHNGYYAGDFAGARTGRGSAAPASGRPTRKVWPAAPVQVPAPPRPVAA